MATREPITDSIIRRLTGKPLAAVGEHDVFVEAIIGLALSEAALSVCDTTDEGEKIVAALDELEEQAHDRLAATVFADPICAYRKAKLLLAAELEKYSLDENWVQVRRADLQSTLNDLKAMRDVEWERLEAGHYTGDAGLFDMLNTARQAWVKASADPTEENEKEARGLDRVVRNMQAKTIAGLAEKVRFMGDRDGPDWTNLILANVTALNRRG
jgi:hypothetical protein